MEFVCSIESVQRTFVEEQRNAFQICMIPLLQRAKTVQVHIHVKNVGHKLKVWVLEASELVGLNFSSFI